MPKDAQYADECINELMDELEQDHPHHKFMICAVCPVEDGLEVAATHSEQTKEQFIDCFASLLSTFAVTFHWSKDETHSFVDRVNDVARNIES